MVENIEKLALKQWMESPPARINHDARRPAALDELVSSGDGSLNCGCVGADTSSLECVCLSNACLEDLVRDLAPKIHRQRLVVEGRVSAVITAADISRYLKDLGRVTDMSVLTEPVTHYSPTHGLAGWVHWETSGAHLYAWGAPHGFFSVDIYTCKAFDADAVAAFTGEFFQATETVSRGF